MTPQFTTSCFVHIEDINKRKEVALKLEKMDRPFLNSIEVLSEFKHIYATKVRSSYLVPDNSPALKEYGTIDCGTNTDLFLALAGMWSDTTLNQYFVCEDRYTDPVLDYQIVEVGTMLKQGEFDEYAKAFYHLATTQEIINHFKSLEK